MRLEEFRTFHYKVVTQDVTSEIHVAVCMCFGDGVEISKKKMSISGDKSFLTIL